MGEIYKIPKDLDLEREILATLMTIPASFGEFSKIIRKDSFFDEAHQNIYGCIDFLHGRNIEVNLLTVTQTFRKRPKQLEAVGGVFYISKLLNNYNIIHNFEYYACILEQIAISRRMIVSNHEANILLSEGQQEIFEILESHKISLDEATNHITPQTDQSFSSGLSEVIQNIEAAAQTTDGITGIASGIKIIDTRTHGWQKTDLIILAARPGMGKTAFVLNCVTHAAMCDVPTAFFSLEMSKVQLITRILSSVSGVYANKFQSGRMSDFDWSVVNAARVRIDSMPLYIDDTPAISIRELSSKAKIMKVKYDIRLLIVDYLQLMSGESKKGQNRENEISDISRGLKKLAKELNVPVIALSQLSRSVETRGGLKVPILSDLRESGSIEQDADQVIFIYRPEYYGLTEDEEGRPTTGLAEIIIAKNRHGALETIPLYWNAPIMKFTDSPEYSPIEQPF